MPYYFMRDTPLQAMEQLMMSQPGQKPRGGGIYRSPCLFVRPSIERMASFFADRVFIP